MPRTDDGAGYRAPDTSEAAAKSIKRAYLSAHKSKICNLIDRNPDGLTVDEISDLLGESQVQRVRLRVSELYSEGAIVDSGKRREVKSGRFGIVWRTPKIRITTPMAKTSLTDQVQAFEDLRRLSTAHGVPEEHLEALSRTLKFMIKWEDDIKEYISLLAPIRETWPEAELTDVRKTGGPYGSASAGKDGESPSA